MLCPMPIDYIVTAVCLPTTNVGLLRVSTYFAALSDRLCMHILFSWSDLGLTFSS